MECGKLDLTRQPVRAGRSASRGNAQDVPLNAIYQFYETISYLSDGLHVFFGKSSTSVARRIGSGKLRRILSGISGRRNRRSPGVKKPWSGLTTEEYVETGRN